MKAIHKLFFGDSPLFISILILMLYSVLHRINFQPGTIIFGLPLFLYFPGMIIVNLISPIRRTFGRFGRFSLAVILSFCISSLIGLVTQNNYGFNSEYQVWAIIVFNVSGLLTGYIISKYFPAQDLGVPANNTTNYKITLRDYFPAIILLIAIIAIVVFNPLPQNLDNYLNILKLSISENKNLLEVRQIFISSFGISFQITKFNIYYTYTYLYLFLFFASSLIFYDYVLRNFKMRKYSPAVLYLSLLVSPAILTEINRTMSQVALLSLTIPVLILSIEAIKTKRISLGLASFFLGVFSLLFHELGAVLIMVAFIALLINIWQLIFINKTTVYIKFIAIALVLILIIFCYSSPVFTPIIRRLQFRLIENLQLVTQNGGIHWRWWFINNYKTVEGIQLGWTGVGALFYYLYGGILLFLPLILLSYFLIRKKLRLGIEATPAILYFLFYFVAAELLPRMNLAFLPNRAWVHMMIPVTLILALQYEKLTINKINLKYFDTFLVSLIAIGYVGTLYLASINLYEVYPSEIPAATYIKNNTPQNAIILSTQNNLTLVNLFANRPYGQIDAVHKINKDEFETLINQKLSILSVDQEINYGQSSFQSPIKYVLNPDKIHITVKAAYSGDNPVYFLYSFSKNGGLNDKREYRQSVVDSINKNTYGNLGYEVVYTDKSTILIKIK